MESLLEKAKRLGWCVRAHCTACEPAQFRSALQDINAFPDRLRSSLASMDFVPWYDLPGGHFALQLAFQALSAPEEVDSVLSAWLRRIDGHLRLADAVLRFVVRPGLPSATISRAWTEAAADLAVQTGDPGLLVGLVEVLGTRFGEDARLIAAARTARRQSHRLREALKRAGYRFSNPPEPHNRGNQGDERPTP